MFVLRRIYSFWCYFWFLGLFFLLFPFFYIFLQKEEWYPRAHYLNRLWGKLFFPVCFLPVKIDYRFKPHKNQVFVFCANHTSLLDIAIMGVVLPNYYAFVGKRALTKIPLFGYMFSKLHIPVDRSSKVSSYRSMTRALETLDKGRSIMIFPEGGIVTKNPPYMTPFKDGPFRMAIEKQVPVVPISIPYNWIILPENSKLLFNPRKIVAVVHEPIPTTGMTMDHVAALKQQTYDIIDTEIKKHMVSASKDTIHLSRQTANHESR